MRDPALDRTILFRCRGATHQGMRCRRKIVGSYGWCHWHRPPTVGEELARAREERERTELSRGGPVTPLPTAKE